MRVPVASFLELAEPWVLVDVRSPGEYVHGHIPGAISLPLFSDQERAEIGTLYKRKGRDPSVRRGLEIVGPKMADFVRQMDGSNTRQLAVYCWRGGMRSGAMSWLFEQAGYEVKTLEGGYKAFRQHILHQIEHAYRYRILGGFTGSAKTAILLRMKEMGAQVVDLEGIARHKGSAFGNLEMDSQPHTEQFANLVWKELQHLDPEKPVWLEDESKTIGTVYLSEGLYRRVRQGPVIFTERTREERAAFLAKDYGDIDRELLKHGFEKITKRLGGQFVKQALRHIEEGELAKAAAIGLQYYDKAYLHGLNKRDPESIVRVDASGWTDEAIATYLIKHQEEWNKFD